MWRKFLSRKFLLAVLFTLLVIVNQKFNLGLDKEALITLALVFASFIGIEGYRDAKMHYAEMLINLANEMDNKDIKETLLIAAKEAFFRERENKAKINRDLNQENIKEK